MKALSISTKSKSYLSQRQAQPPRNRKTEDNKIAELIEQCRTWSLDAPSKLKSKYDMQPSTPKQIIDPNGQLTNEIVLVSSGDDGFRTMLCGNPDENQGVLDARLNQNQVTNIKQGHRLQSQQNFGEVLVSALAPAELTTSPMGGIQRSYNPILYRISNNQSQAIPNEYANYSSAVNSNNALEQMKSAYQCTNQVQTQSMLNLRKAPSRSPSSQAAHLGSAENSISTKPTENQPHNCASPEPSTYTALRRASSSRFFQGKHRLLRKELKVMGALQINRESDDFKARMQKVKKAKEYGERIRQMNCVLVDEFDHNYKVRNNVEKSDHKPSRHSPIIRHNDNPEANAGDNGEKLSKINAQTFTRSLRRERRRSTSFSSFNEISRKCVTTDNEESIIRSKAARKRISKVNGMMPPIVTMHGLSMKEVTVAKERRDKMKEYAQSIPKPKICKKSILPPITLSLREVNVTEKPVAVESSELLRLKEKYFRDREKVEEIRRELKL